MGLLGSAFNNFMINIYCDDVTKEVLKMDDDELIRCYMHSSGYKKCICLKEIERRGCSHRKEMI